MKLEYNTVLDTLLFQIMMMIVTKVVQILLASSFSFGQLNMVNEPSLESNREKPAFLTLTQHILLSPSQTNNGTIFIPLATRNRLSVVREHRIGPEGIRTVTIARTPETPQSIITPRTSANIRNRGSSENIRNLGTPENSRAPRTFQNIRVPSIFQSITTSGTSENRNVGTSENIRNIGPSENTRNLGTSENIRAPRTFRITRTPWTSENSRHLGNSINIRPSGNIRNFGTFQNIRTPRTAENIRTFMTSQNRRNPVPVMPTGFMSRWTQGIGNINRQITNNIPNIRTQSVIPQTRFSVSGSQEPMSRRNNPGSPFQLQMRLEPTGAGRLPTQRRTLAQLIARARTFPGARMSPNVRMSQLGLQIRLRRQFSWITMFFTTTNGSIVLYRVSTLL